MSFVIRKYIQLYTEGRLIVSLQGLEEVLRNYTSNKHLFGKKNNRIKIKVSLGFRIIYFLFYPEVCTTSKIMNKITKQYQLWTFSDGGYHLTEFDSIEDCINETKYTNDWYITKKVDIIIKEKE
jgi:hypothetical protein